MWAKKVVIQNDVGLKTTQFFLLCRENHRSPSPMCLLYFHTGHFTSDTCGHQMCVFFSPHIKQFCNISWVSYNLTQFWHCLPGDSITSHRLRAEFHKTAPHFRCQSQVVDPQVTHNFSLSWLQIRGSHDFLPLGLDYLLEWLTDSGKHLFRFTSLLKDMIKDTDEQPDEELHKAKSGRVLSAGTSVSSRVGVCHPFGTWMCSPTWKFSQPHIIAIFWRLHHTGKLNY